MTFDKGSLINLTAPLRSLVDLSALVSAYWLDVPDPTVAAQRVSFGTSGHRGSSLDRSFNEWHVLAITQAICNYRNARGINGPLFLGIDTHALSQPACASALEVLAANNVDVMLATHDEYTPTPAVSHAILGYNQGRVGRSGTGLADGIVVTPSHNPPRDGGFKYNPPHGGPAGQAVTSCIEREANRLIDCRLAGVNRISHSKALQAATTHHHDYLNTYVADLANVLDMDVIRESKLHIGVDPLGGAGVHYWSAIAERYRFNLTVIPLSQNSCRPKKSADDPQTGDAKCKEKATLPNSKNKHCAKFTSVAAKRWRPLPTNSTYPLAPSRTGSVNPPKAVARTHLPAAPLSIGLPPNA